MAVKIRYVKADFRARTSYVNSTGHPRVSRSLVGTDGLGTNTLVGRPIYLLYKVADNAFEKMVGISRKPVRILSNCK
jgi:hypothetical protein